MANRKPLVAVNGRAREIPSTDNLTVPSNVVVGGAVDVNGRALPGWGVPQRDRCAGSWSVRTSAANNGWLSVCWAPKLGLFCAVANTGTNNRVMTSPDGVNWTTRTSAADNNWRSVCWAPELGMFCAVASSGTNNRVMTSFDGFSWQTQTSAADNDWTSVCWAPELGLFCAVASTGTSNRVMTSTNGSTWTSQITPGGLSEGTWNSVCWAAEINLFCAVSPNFSSVMTSPDGATWTIRTGGSDVSDTVCWASELGLFCAITVTGNPMTSPDGITWTIRTGVNSNPWRSICWASELGLFCATATSGTGNRVMTSPDGITWTSRTSAADNAWFSVCWAPELGLFCAVASTGTNNRVMCSSPVYPPIYLTFNRLAYFPSIATTASAANAFIDTTSLPANILSRSTSSLRYKTDVEDLGSEYADAILQVRPVWYRSLIETDNKEWSAYGFIAEELAQIEPRLAQWAWSEPEYETVTLADGTIETHEKTPARLIPDGVQYDRINVLLLSVLKRQQEEIEALEAEIAALEGSQP